MLREFIRTRDLSTRNRVVMLHEPLVRFLAGRLHALKAIPTEDLVQLGFMALIGAVERFDPDAGVAFSTFASVTVVGAMKNHVRDRRWTIDPPRTIHDLWTRSRQLRDELERRLGRPPNVAEVAETAGVSEERLLEAMEMEHLAAPVSLDCPAGKDSDQPEWTFADLVGAADARIDQVDARTVLEAALDRLDDRERAVIRHRYWDDASQGAVAARLGCSQMHVSRLERKALAQLRDMLT